MTLSKTNQQGFTLIEVLVVLAIIGLMASLALSAFASVRAKGRDAKRKADLVQIQTALELYFNTYDTYPQTGGGPLDTDDQYFRGLSASAQTNCSPTCTDAGVNGWIPSLAPEFISKLPADPLGRTDIWSGYSYASNGKNYKVIAHSSGPESWPEADESFYDPERPNLAWMVTNNATSTAGW